MSLRLLRRQQNMTMGTVVLLILVGTFFYGLLTRQIDWMQMVMVIFTVYAIVILTAPLLIKEKEAPRNDFYRPFVSILLPAKNEEQVIESTLLSLSRLHYHRNGRPHFEIIAVDDGSTDRTGLILKFLERKLDNLVVVTRPLGGRNGKAAALNEGLSRARGEVIAVFDADTQVNPDFFVKSVALLCDDRVGGVQGRVKLYNPDDNLVTRLQNDEFLVFNHFTQKGKDILGGVTCLGGNGQIVKRESLEAVGGWNEESLTEDFDLTFRLLLHGFRVKYAEHALLWQEAAHTWKSLLRQRIRWGQGLLTSLFDFFLPVLSARMTWSQRLDGILTLTRILLPFWVIEGYVYESLAWLKHQPFLCRLAPTPMLLGAFTTAFFALMAWSILRISPAPWLKVGIRVLQYWLYALVWVLVLPISYFNYFKAYRNFYWDKTSHKGLEIPLSQSTTSVFS